MNGIVNRTQTARRASLGPGPFVARTGGTYVPQTRQALGQGEVSLYLTEFGEFAPEVATWSFAEEEQPAEIPAESPMEEFAGWFFGQPTPTVLLKRGDRGDQVRALQTQLRRLGFPAGSVDGIYGPLTEQAVRLFQESVNLPATGTVDEVTWAAVQSAVPAAPGGGIPAPRVPAPTPEGPLEVPPRMRVSPTPEGPLEVPPARRLPPSTAEAAAKELLGLPVGIWVALGIVVVVLIATTTPAPALLVPPKPGALRA